MAYQQQQGRQAPPQGQGQAYGGGQNPQFISDQASRQANIQHQHLREQQQQQQQHQNQAAQRDLALFGSKPPPIPTEYVYFDRNPSFSKHTLEKAQAAKLKLEHYYQKAVQEAIERNTR
jgi:protein-serine/threonine kinase